MMGNVARKFAALLVALPLYTASAQTVNLCDEADPFIGTAGEGLTSPAASLPFGRSRWQKLWHE